MPYPRRPGRTGPSRQQRKNEADSALAEFIKRGGRVQHAPTVVATEFACASCGHRGIIGAVEGKQLRCPRCREPIHIKS